MRKLFFQRPTLLLVVIALWICFASTPTAETRQLLLKVSGELDGATNGALVKAKIANATLKQNGDENSKVVLDIGESTTIDHTIVTTVTAVATASLSNGVVSINLSAMSSTTIPSVSVSPNLPVCSDSSVTDVLTLATALLSNGSAVASIVFTNSQIAIIGIETNLDVNTIVTFSTNGTTTCVGGDITENIILTTSLTNIVTTNTFTNAVTDAISVLLLDPQGNLLSTFFEFDTVTSINKSNMSEKIFGLGAGVDSLAAGGVFGDVTFDSVVLFGNLQLTSDDEPRSASATIQASGNSNLGAVLFKGRLEAGNPFVAKPTNLNVNASSK